MISGSRELRYQIVGDARDFNRTLQGIDRKLGQSESRSKRFGKALTAAFAGGVVLSFGKKMISTASDINESLTKNQRLFGRYAKDVERFSRTSADAFGISRKAALEYTGVFGNLARSSGIGQKASAGLSVELTKLAADLASFNNTSIEDALEALRSGLVGETEPLRRFGVTLSANAVQAEAFASGIAKAKVDSVAYSSALVQVEKAQVAYNEAVAQHGRGSLEARSASVALEKANAAVAKATKGSKVELTAQQKALATVGLITKQTANAQGDFARTSGGLANQNRILRARFEDLTAALGSKLLPVVNDGVGKLNRFIDQMKSGKGAGGDFARALRDIRDALRPVVNFLKDHPRLIAVAVGAWATYKAATKLALAAINVRMFRQVFMRSVPAAGAAGTAAGAAFATGQGAGSAGGGFAGKAGAEVKKEAGKAGRLGRAFSGAGRALGIAAGVAAVAAMADQLRGGSGGLKGLIENIMPLSPRGNSPRTKDNVVIYRDGKPISQPNRGNYPLGKTGKVIGVPYQGTHNLGNWQSDNAIDISVPVGTNVLAVEDGKIIKVAGGYSGGQSRFDGFQVTLEGESGRQVFYTHLSKCYVRSGQRVKRGDVIGKTGAANGVAHLHIGVSKGNPVDLFQPGKNRGGIGGTGVRPGNRSKGTQGTGGPTGTGVPTYRGGGGRSRTQGSAKPGGGKWAPCELTYYKPSLGGINADSDASTYADGSPVNENNDMVCAAPSKYPFGTRIEFSYGGRSVVCVVRDRGGAITGNRFDLIWNAAQELGITSAGRVKARFRVVRRGTSTREPITRLDQLTAGMDEAALTPSLKDDRRAGRSLVSYWRGRLRRARQTHNPRAISIAASGLSEAQDLLKGANDPFSSGVLERIDSMIAQAELTHTLHDDIKWTGRKVKFLERALKAARKDGDNELAGTLATDLASTKADLRDLRARQKARTRKANRPPGRDITGGSRPSPQSSHGVGGATNTDRELYPTLLSTGEYSWGGTTAADTATADMPSALDLMNADVSIAELDDDPNNPATYQNNKTALEAIKKYHEDRFVYAMTVGNKVVAGEEAEALKAVTDALKSLDDTINANTDALNQQKADLATELKRQNDITQQVLASQSGTIMQGIADMVSGAIGGNVGLGYATPSYPGGRSRY